MKGKAFCRFISWIGPGVVLAVLVGCGGAKGRPDPAAITAIPDAVQPIARPAVEPRADHLALARALMDQGHYAVALVQLDQAAGQKEADPCAMAHLRGVCYRETDDLDRAEAAFRRAMAHNQDYAPAHNGLGLTLMRAGRIEEALAALRRAASLDPARAEVLNNLGFALLKTGRPAEAEPVLRRCLAVAPNLITARNNLAVSLGLQDRDGEALALLLAIYPREAATGNLAAIRRLRADKAVISDR